MGRATFGLLGCFGKTSGAEIMEHTPLNLPRRLIWAVLAAGVIFSLGMGRTSSSLSPRDRTHVFEKVWKEVDEHYYYPEFGGVDWQAIHQRYLPLVEATKDDKDFYSLVDRMTAELHDAHTRFSSPEQWKNREMHVGVSPGFRAGYVDGKVVVLDVYPGQQRGPRGNSGRE